MSVHLEILVEEPSMEAFLQGLLPRLLPQNRTFTIHSFQGKKDLFKKLKARLRGYKAWLPESHRVVVMVDRDHDDCRELKRRMEEIAAEVGLQSRTRSPTCWQLVNRIVIEELEAWYFGAWDAVVAVYPKLPATLSPRYRNSDAIPGGTWEALEGILQRHGYFKSGIRKIELARTLGQRIDPFRCQSPSFQCFRDTLLETIGSTGPGKNQP